MKDKNEQLLGDVRKLWTPESETSVLDKVERKMKRRLARYKLKKQRATAIHNRAGYGIKCRATMECLRDLEYERMAAMPYDES